MSPPRPAFVLHVWWWELDIHKGRGIIAYRGRLAGEEGIRVRYGFDGWSGDPIEVPLQQYSPGLALASIEGLETRSVVDVAIHNGAEWDNNHGVDYRLWITITPVDSHLHAASQGMDRLGLGALNVALSSAGIANGIISWRDNLALDSLVADDPRFHRLVWVDPRRMKEDEVVTRLAAGHVGLKLHPVEDGYPADHPRLDPYMEAARAAGTPVAIHSGPGHSDPAKIARLASRFPTVPVILYHTYLGFPWGRRRAAHLARTHPNLVLETSWCLSAEVEWLVDELGPERVIFGSDASVDGAHHFTNRNLGGRETYRENMLRIVQRIGIGAARLVLGENARRLFRLGGG